MQCMLLRAVAIVATLTGHNGWEQGDWAARLIGRPAADQGGLTDEQKADAHLLIECLPRGRCAKDQVSGYNIHQAAVES